MASLSVSLPVSAVGPLAGLMCPDPGPDPLSFLLPLPLAFAPGFALPYTPARIDAGGVGYGCGEERAASAVSAESATSGPLVDGVSLVGDVTSGGAAEVGEGCVCEDCAAFGSWGGGIVCEDGGGMESASSCGSRGGVSSQVRGELAGTICESGDGCAGCEVMEKALSWSARVVFLVDDVFDPAGACVDLWSA